MPIQFGTAASWDLHRVVKPDQHLHLLAADISSRKRKYADRSLRRNSPRMRRTANHMVSFVLLPKRRSDDDIACHCSASHATLSVRCRSAAADWCAFDWGLSMSVRTTSAHALFCFFVAADVQAWSSRRLPSATARVCFAAALVELKVANIEMTKGKTPPD